MNYRAQHSLKFHPNLLYIIRALPTNKLSRQPSDQKFQPKSKQMKSSDNPLRKKGLLQRRGSKTFGPSKKKEHPRNNFTAPKRKVSKKKKKKRKYNNKQKLQI